MRRLRKRYGRHCHARCGHAYVSKPTFVVQEKTGNHWWDFSPDFETLEEAQTWYREARQMRAASPMLRKHPHEMQVKMYLPGDYR